MKYILPSTCNGRHLLLYPLSFSNQITAIKKICFVLGMLLPGVCTFAQKTVSTLHLKTGDLVMKENMVAEKITAEINKGRFGGVVYTVLVFDQPITASAQNTLRNAGIELLYYLPDNAYQVRMKTIPSFSLLFQAGVRAVANMQGSAKLGKEIKASVSANNSPAQPLLVNLQLYPGVKLADVSSILAFYGVSITRKEYANQGLLQASVPAGRITALSDLPFIASLNLSFMQYELLNQRERGAFGLTNLLSSEAAGRNLLGSGTTVGVGDNADPTLHIDNTTNIINRNPAYRTNGHGRHVTGTVSGDGIGDERFKGVAVNSRVIADYFDYILIKTPLYYSDYQMTVTNNSYYNGLAGCPGNREYNELSAYADQQMYTNPFLQHIFAAGNDGNRTCSPYPVSFGTIKSGYQCSKNVLDVGDYSISSDNLNTSSSKGPVDDGRIKPEIIASGAGVWSTNNNISYSQGFGTSHAAPFVTGVWSLLTERYKQLNGGVNPKSALLKAMICNSGDDRGNPGPDYSWGFGFINPRKAVEMLENNRYYSGTISTGGNSSQVISVPAGTRQVKVMLYWHDKDAMPLAATALVNDLDLTVVDGGTTYQPWVLNPAPGFVNTPAIRSDDHLNNIEQVTINNPGTSITVNVNGFDVPDGPMEFFVTYEFLMDEIKLEYPYGGEKFSPGQEEIIKWTATDNSSNTFTIEMSTDNGATWTVIDNAVAASQHRYRWTVPASYTNRGKIRITRNGGGASMTSPGNFTILDQQLLTATVPCEGYVDLSWTASSGITDYEVLQLVNGSYSSIATTTLLNYRVSGLDRNQTYYFTVRPRLTDSVGLRATAVTITPSLSTPCTAAEFDNDLTIDSLITPAHGRQNTGSALTASNAITVRIKNLDDAATSGSYNISYQVNGGPVVTETSSAVIAAGSTVDYMFTSTANLAAVFNYNIRLIIAKPGDGQNANNEKTFTIKHVGNPAVILPFTETFELTGANDEYKSNFFALLNANRFDFSTANSNGRLRTFINSGASINGNRAVTMDATNYNDIIASNSLIATINLSSYTASTGLRFDFKFKNHGQLKTPAAGVWMRGSDSQPWVQIYDLAANQGGLGEVKQVSYNITDLGQPVSSSFQVRFDQQSETSANNGSYDPDIPDMDDGFMFDDVSISEATNDIMATKIISPDTFLCGASAVPVTIRVRNTTSTTFNNVPVFYRVDNSVGLTAGSIPVLPPGFTDYTFTANADLSFFKTYDIDVWVKNTGDNYAVNDSVVNHIVHNSPVVTTYPYLQRFPDDEANWFAPDAYTSWKWGQPFKGVINKSADGLTGWHTNLAGTYKQNEFSFLYSPCFDVSSLAQPVLSFSHIIQQEDNCNCDYHSVEYTTDNGNNWQRLGTVGSGTNWFDSSNLSWRRTLQRWHVSSSDLPAGSTNIRFRFLFSSDQLTQREGVGIDDIHIFDKGTVYTGPNVTVSQSVNGSGWVNFNSGGNIIAAINPMGQDLGNTDVSAFIHTGAVRFTAAQYYLNRNLVIRTANVPTDSVLVRFYFTEQEAAALIGATGCGTCSKPVDAYVVGVNKFSGSVANENGTLADNGGAYLYITPQQTDIIPFNNGYYAEFKVRSFSEFWINTGGAFPTTPLPVTLLSFDGFKRLPDIELQWETSAETNSSRFEIERSQDGNNIFTAIGSVAAKGNTSQKTVYGYTDRGVLQKGSRLNYRLKMIDTDGKFTYSNTINFTNKEADVFIENVYNNAGSNELMIAAGNKAGIKEMHIRILNGMGQTVLSRKYSYQDTRVNIGLIAAGNYILEITGNNGSASFRQKFVKR
jgi:hypothetical protein